AGVKGNIKATVPWGVIREFPDKTVGGYRVKAEIFATALGADIDIAASGSVSYQQIDCPDENCGTFGLGVPFSASIGPQINGQIKLVSCNDPADPGCSKYATLVGGAIKGLLGVNISGSIGLN